MKKNSFDFTIPSRQSYVAILMIILKTWRIIFRQAWPFLLIVLFGRGGSNTTKYLAIGIGAAALIGMVIAIINFFRYYFYINGEEIVIESGVVNRKRLAIPFDRVQTINLEQNILHQIFQVVGLEIDTAGSAKSEFKFDAISRDKAEALQKTILSKKRKLRKEAGQEDVEEEEVDRGEEIFRLSIEDIIKIGLTQNHIRSGGLILVFIFWVYQNLQDAGINVEDYGEEIPTVSFTLSFIGFFGMALLIVVILISLVRTFVVNYNLRLRRIGDGFNIQSGLFTRKDVSAKDRKIQIITWGDNLLKRLIGIFDLSIKQASSIAVQGKKSIRVPGVNLEKIELIKTMLYGPHSTEDISWQGVDVRYLYRRIIYTTIFFSGLFTILYFLDRAPYIPVVLVILAYFIITSIIRFRKIKWGYNDRLLVVKGGVWGDKATVLPVYKIQAIRWTQNFYQQRKKLATAVIDSAAGSIRIPYLDNKVVDELTDTLLYKVERSKKAWM